jgi:hypothetical protein
MAKWATGRAERLERELAELYPPPPTPEETKREAEAFLNSWAQDIAKAAHAARARRARAEPLSRPIDQLSGLEICGEACSYAGHPPPESVRAALWALTHDRGAEGVISPEMADKFNAATQEAFRRGVVLFVAELDGNAPTS